MFLVIRVEAQDTTRLSLLFAGDVMGHDSQIASARQPAGGYDYTACFQFIKPYVAAADIAIANLEVTLAGPPYKGYPQFSSPDALAAALKDMGFDALVTANNHCVDRGRNGLERTIAVLDSLDFPHTGTFVDTVSRMNDAPLLLQRNGITLALLNYTYGTNGLAVQPPAIVNHLDTLLIALDILRSKELKADVIIVFTHWGLEYQRLPSKAEITLTEFCFRNGVQLVVGSHPHVLQPMEWRVRENQFVAYSLGNFVSGQRKQYTDGGALAYIELQKIAFTPDSSVAVIDSAAYMLEWVYRTADADRDYYILPVHKVETDTVGFIKDSGSKAAFKTFSKDARELYKKHNKNVPELQGLPRSFLRKPEPDEVIPEN
jgi:poly-gamma-glutamate synthesis protein (capsule biosynthesis protein)